jgi:hypothetical protein
MDRRLSALKTERVTFEPHWREIAEYFLPRSTRWFLDDTNRGQKKHQRIIDNTTTRALRTLASGMMAGLTSPARPWFRLTTPDPDLAEFGAVKQWLHSVELRMRELFNKSNLYNALPTAYAELGAYGTSGILMLEDDEDVLRFYPQTVGSYWVAQSSRLDVDTLYRELRFTVRQCVQEFGIDAVSVGVREAFRRGNYEQKVDVIHAIEPNDERLLGALGAQGMEYRSCWFEKSCSSADDASKFLRESGMREKPFVAPRWETTGEDTYGSSPGMDALGDAKALMLQQRRKAQAIDKMIDPPLMGPTSLRNQRVSLLPGDVTYVDINQQGQSLRSIYDVRLDPSMLLEDTRAIQDRINASFYADLFLMLSMSDRRQITAREIEERHEEKLLMLGPVLERLNDEMLDPIIERTFGIMMRAGQVPPPPMELEGVDLKVEYISILAQAQKMLGIATVDRFVGFVGQMAQVDPKALDKLDVDQTIDEYAEMTGVSPRIVRSDDDVAAMRAERQQQEQMQRMAAMAQPMQQAAGAAQTLADTEVSPDSLLANLTGGMMGSTSA